MRQFVALFRQEIHPRRLVPTLVAGSITGISAVLYAISFPALILQGELSSYLSIGVSFGLLSTAILNVVTTLLSSLPGMVVMIQEAPVVLFALMVQTITQQASGAASATFVTVIAAMSLASLLTGMVCFLLGWFKLGNLIRFIPYPIVGGFLAGTGWLLSLGAISLLIDRPVTLNELPQSLHAAPVLQWLPGCLFGIVLLLILRRFSHVLLLPGMILAGAILFYTLLLLTGTSIAAARDSQLFLSFATAETLWSAFPIATFSQIDWLAVIAQAGTITCVLLVTVLGLLLNATGIELAAATDMDLNRELKATGVANVLCSFSGGLIGFHSLGLSTLSYAKLHARSRLTGLIVALMNLFVLMAGVSVISFFPKAILGGLLLFLGLEFLVDWLYSTWFTLPKLDYFIVLFISLVITLVGFLQGVGLGLVIAIALFVINYSRISVAKHTFSGAGHQSNQVRTLPQIQLLREQGDQIYVLCLQGFLFFGTVNQLSNLIRQHLVRPHQVPLKFIVLDFRSVVGLDSSGVFGFVKLRQLAQQQAFTLVFTSLSPPIQRQLQRGGCLTEPSCCEVLPDLDRGLEWCENQLLGATTWRRRRTLPLTLQLNQLFATEGHATVLMHYLEKMAIEPEQVLFQTGDPADCLYFIQQGQITTWLALADGSSKRMQTAGAGNMIGEMDFFLDRSRQTSAVVDEAGQVYRLSSMAFQKMQQENPETAVMFQDYVIRLLSEHLAGAYQEFAEFVK